MTQAVAKVTDLLMEEEKPFDYKYYIYLFRRKFSIILTFFIIAVTIAAIASVKKPVLYQSACQVILEEARTAFEGANYQDELRFRDQQQGIKGVLGDPYYNTQKQIMVGTSVLKRVVEELKLLTYFETENPEVAIAKVRSMISISRAELSRIVAITVTAKDSNIVASVANSVAKNYIEKSFEDSMYYDKEILTWLEEGGQDGSGYITITDAFGNVKRVKYEELIETLPALQTDQTLRTLKTQENKVKMEIEDLEHKYRAKHPLMIKAHNDLKFVQSDIDSQKKAILRDLKSRAEGQLRSKPGRVIEEARPPNEPIPIDRYRKIIIAGLVAIFLGGALIFALDYFDDTIRIMEDFERRGVNIPFLGPLPLVEELARVSKRIPVLTSLENEDDRVAVEEAFRYLRVAINFSAPPETVRTLAITSCLPGDGKSFVSTNLASSLALDGNKVLLIDADLRRPVVHSTFQLPNDTGLSNYLTQEVELHSVIKECAIENLFILCSGPISPNPTEILGSERMQALLNEASREYDRIIVDCPPLTGIGDGFVVGGLIGYLLLIIAASKTPADLVKHTQQQIDKMGIKILGTVLNRMDVHRERYGAYSKHYYSTYTKYYRRK